MVELYEPGTVLIVPLLGGSGTRVKILEAWSLGVPVIATPKGAAGLGARDGVELLSHGPRPSGYRHVGG